MRGCAPKHCDPAVWGVALLCSWTISFCQGNTHTYSVCCCSSHWRKKKKHLQFTEWMCVWDMLEAHRRCRSSLIWLLNSTSHPAFPFSWGQTRARFAGELYETLMLCSLISSFSLNALDYKANLQRPVVLIKCRLPRARFSRLCTLFVDASPAGGALACDSFSRTREIPLFLLQWNG